MYRQTFALAAVLFAIGPALAQDDRGNAAQPNEPVPQTGQTSGGPRETPATPEKPGPGSAGPAASDGAAASAKGGNAGQTNKPSPNVGGTSGGPAR